MDGWKNVTYRINEDNMSLILYLFQDSSNSGGGPLVIFHPLAAKVVWCCRYVRTETLKYNEN